MEKLQNFTDLAIIIINTMKKHLLILIIISFITTLLFSQNNVSNLATELIKKNEVFFYAEPSELKISSDNTKNIFSNFHLILYIN